MFGRGLDLWVGCGLGYIALLPVLLIYALANDVRAWPLGAVTAMALLINAPHYGATILRAYANPTDRAKYRWFTLHATLALVLALAVGSHSWWVASILITFYLTWSPYHFAGQNYGIALMFLRRRGVEVDAAAKRLLSLSFTLSAVLAILAIHTRAGQYSVTPPTVDMAGAPRLLALDIPLPLLLIAITAVAYIICLVAAARRLRRTGLLRGSAAGVDAGRDAGALVRGPRSGAEQPGRAASVHGGVGLHGALGAVSVDHRLLREALGAARARRSVPAQIPDRGR